MRVRHEIGMHTRQRKQLIQVGMVFRWLRYPCCFASEPGAHLAPRIDQRLGPFEYPWIDYKAQKRKQAIPGQPDAGGTSDCWSTQARADLCCE